MATRRSFMSRMEPSMPMTPRGGESNALSMMDGASTPSPMNDGDPNAPAPYESTQAFRRRVLPLVDAPTAGPSVLQQLTAMLGDSGNGYC